MIVGLRTYTDSPYFEYYDVPISDKDTARKVVYKFVFKGTDPSFDTLMRQTTIIETRSIPEQVVEYLK